MAASTSLCSPPPESPGTGGVSPNDYDQAYLVGGISDKRDGKSDDARGHGAVV